MRLSRRLTASIVAPTLLGAALAGCASGPIGRKTADVIIGADLAAGSPTDTAYARALQLMVDQINASGQLGQRRLALRIQDNRSDPAASLRNINALADDPAVSAIVTGSCTPCLTGAAKTVNEKKIPTIALMAADLRHIPPDGQRWIFKLGPNPADDASALRTDLRRIGTKRVAIVYSDDPASTDAFASLTGGDGYPYLSGIDVTATRQVKATATDISQAVGALVDAQPDVLAVLTGPDQAALAATSARAAHFNGRLYLDATAAGDLFLPRTAARAMNGAIMVFTPTLAIDDVIATTPAKASRKQWFVDYTSRYGAFNGAGAFAADAASLIAIGVARSGTGRDNIRNAIETAQFDGLSGPIRLIPKYHSGLMPQALTLLVVREGRWRLATSKLG